MAELTMWTIRTQDSLPTGPQNRKYQTKWARPHNWYAPYRRAPAGSAFIPYAAAERHTGTTRDSLALGVDADPRIAHGHGSVGGGRAIGTCPCPRPPPHPAGPRCARAQTRHGHAKAKRIHATDELA